MRYFIVGLFIILVFSIQVSVFSFFSVFSIKPDLLLIVVLLWAVNRGGKQGALIGAFCGLLQDLFSSTFFIQILTRAFIGYVIGSIKESLSFLDSFSVAVFVFCVSVISGMIDAVLLRFFFDISYPGFSIISILVLGSLYNALLAPLILPIVNKVIKFSEGSAASTETIYRLR